MKNIILTLFLCCSKLLFAQDYEKQWEKVTSLEFEGNIKSADKIVQRIYRKAHRNKNEAQIIKTFFYISKYSQVLEENPNTQILNRLKKESEKLSIPSQAIIEYIYADCLENYLSTNDYSISQRTKIDTTEYQDGFLTWTTSDFEKAIESAYKKSLKNQEQLIKTPLLDYELLFDFNKYEDFKSLSLFDFLACEAIDYYKKKAGYGDLEKLAPYKEALLNVSPEFNKLKLPKTSYSSILFLYHQLEKESNNYQKHRFNRIQFTSSLFSQKSTLYLKTLEQLQKITTDEKTLLELRLEKAETYRGNASKENNKTFLISAVKELDSILLGGKSQTYKKAANLKNRITEKQLNLQLQQFIYTNENTRCLINYKNLDNFNLSFHKINQNEFASLKNENNNWDSIAQILKQKHPALKKISYTLENKKDYFQYTTEKLLPKLEIGTYLVIAESQTQNDTLQQKSFGHSTITVSDLSVLSYVENNSAQFRILDRKTGQPIENASLNYENTILKSDHKGHCEGPIKNNEYYFNPEVTVIREKDTLSIPSTYIERFFENSNNNKETKGKISLYLDRAIYRPGQTVYFKGIAHQQKNKKSSIVPNIKAIVILESPNNETLKELELKTNAFGSFSGEFLLPKTGLTGDFRIYIEEPDNLEDEPGYDAEKDEHPFWEGFEENYSEVRFKVEEYKRPKFEIRFDPIKKSFIVNQKIAINGKAIAFAGSNLTDAKVSYSIERKSYRNLSRQYPLSSEMITQGETKTDSEGKFEIVFEALPDMNLKKTDLPVFEYIITATATDINGETQSKTTQVKVGYHGLSLNLNLPKYSIKSNEKTEITFSSSNLNGESLPVQGKLEFFLIDVIENKWKDRLWPKPEIQGISDAEFDQLFPYEKNRRAANSEDKGQLIYTKTINTKTDSKIAADFLLKWKTGKYRIVFSATDNYGNPIQDTTDFELYSHLDKPSPSKELFTVKQINQEAKNDRFALIEIASNFTDLYISYKAFNNNQIIFSEAVQLKNKKAIVKIPLNENQTEGTAISFETVFENTRSFQKINVVFPKENTPFYIETESMRSLLSPAGEEKWAFKVIGNEKQQAELLASMYDSSLDQFTQDNWKPLFFNNYNYNNVSNSSALGFRKTNLYLQNINEKQFYRIEDTSTKLLKFGFDFSFSDNYLRRTKHSSKNKTKRIPSNAKLITGIVTEGSLPLPGVAVYIKGTSRGTQTDFDGYYEIDAAPGEELIFSFIGMEEKKVFVSTKIHDVSMIAETKRLESVVVMAHSTIKATESDLKDSDNNSIFAKKLQGQIAGVNINSASGKPGNQNTSNIIIRGASSIDGTINPLYVLDGAIISANEFLNLNSDEIVTIDVLKKEAATTLYGTKGTNGAIVITTKKAQDSLMQVQTRKNLNETAFFFPHLQTDTKGQVSFSFTSPEALTQWKLRLLVHNKKANSAYLEKTVLTQKELMVIPNFPRFVREKDTVYITTKIANLTSEVKQGMAMLNFFNAATMQPVDLELANNQTIKPFNLGAKGNTTVTWKIVVPIGIEGLQYKILAKAGNFTDGEENILPVLTNSLLVTESLPLWVRGNSKKEYSLDNLKSTNSSTLRHHQITLEYTSNPTWLTLQSLPYLIQYEHECSEQTFARYYGNVLASSIIKSNPKIAEVLNNWRNNKKAPSKLMQNEELKTIILAETPWLNDAQPEDEKKRNLSLLLDLTKMSRSLNETFEKLKQKQSSSGGFPWFEGYQESEYITRHILAGFGHLSSMKINDTLKKSFKSITDKGIVFIDKKFFEQHQKRIQVQKDKKMIWPQPYNDLHYLYTRSFYLKEHPLNEKQFQAIKLYLSECKTNWLDYSLYEKGMAALVLHRFNETATAKKILNSLKETSSNNQDWGMYWINNKSGWFWHQAPIETQALLIEAFAEISNDIESVEAMKVWLLKNKQIQNWPTTKATTEAVYALLMQGKNWLEEKDNTIIKVGNEKILSKKLTENEKEAQTGYIKLDWKSDEIKKDMAQLSIQNKSNVPGFGGYYWQYFEELDKINSFNGTGLNVKKELYLKKSKPQGAELEKIFAGTNLKIGDLVTVRLIITASENVEYIHLKDMRAATFEPVNTLSNYYWKEGLEYYQSTKDIATHFFFDHISKGTYVLEYDLRINNMGEFSTGITTIQSMYAPEFTSHTKGTRIKVTE